MLEGVRSKVFQPWFGKGDSVKNEKLDDSAFCSSKQIRLLASGKIFDLTAWTRIG